MWVLDDRVVKQATKSWSVAVILALAILGFAREQACAQTPRLGSGALTETSGVKEWAELVSGLEFHHPHKYYLQAAELFALGRRDEAVFLFYLGQLRWRIHLRANPQFLPGNEPAAFAAVSEVLGRVFNQYAFGDIPVLARTIQAVLDFDAAYPDRFTAKPTSTKPPTPRPATAKHRREIRQGLADLRKRILEEAEIIRSKRREQGLENRN
jgi:hypothetical protein